MNRASFLFAAHAIAIPVKMAPIAGVAAPDGRGTGSARCRAIGVRCPAAGNALGPFGGRPAAALLAMAMPPAIFAIIMAAVGRQAAGMRRGAK